jgi:hypothetical protein
MMPIAVYCSGSIAKSAADNKKLCWTDVERDAVSRGAKPTNVVFLNPDDPITDVSNTLGQFGRDMYQVMVAGAIIVDARERRGIGIGVEMAAASAMGTPVVIVAPRNSQYRADELSYRGVTVKNYIHPHVSSLAAVLVEDFEEAGAVLASVATGRDRRQEVPSWLAPAIEEYEQHVLPGDPPMLEALRSLDS